MKKSISFSEDVVNGGKREDVRSRKEDQAARVLQKNWRKYSDGQVSAELIRTDLHGRFWRQCPLPGVCCGVRI